MENRSLTEKRTNMLKDKLTQKEITQQRRGFNTNGHKHCEYFDKFEDQLEYTRNRKEGSYVLTIKEELKLNRDCENLLLSKGNDNKDDALARVRRQIEGCHRNLAEMDKEKQLAERGNK